MGEVGVISTTNTIARATIANSRAKLMMLGVFLFTFANIFLVEDEPVCEDRV